MSKVIKCKTCGSEIASSAKTCPSCGAKNKKAFYTKWWFWAIAIFVIIGAVGGQGTSDKSNTNIKSSDNQVATNTVDSVTKDENNKDESIIKNDDKKVEEETNVKEEAKVPKEYENALKKAQIYSDTMYMSEKSLYKQLTSEYGEGFTEEAAQYAIDNVDADYNYNAYMKALTYQDSMSMSKNNIYEQLISEYGEQFTEEEATYAVNKLNE